MLNSIFFKHMMAFAIIFLMAAPIQADLVTPTANLATLIEAPDTEAIPESIRATLPTIKLEGIDELEFTLIESRYKNAPKVVVPPPASDKAIHRLIKDAPQVTFYILTPESEIILKDGKLKLGIAGLEKKLVSEYGFHHVVPFTQGKFDEEVYEAGVRASLISMHSMAAGVDNLHVKKAAEYDIVVTNSSGPLRGPMAEKNNVVSLDGRFKDVSYYDPDPNTQERDGWISFKDLKNRHPIKEEVNGRLDPRAIFEAQVLFYHFLQSDHVIKLDKMKKFGRSGRWFGAGVAEKNTVFHTQLGQNKEAGLEHSVAVAGLEYIGTEFLRYLIAFQVKTINILDEEYKKLDNRSLSTLRRIIKAISQDEGIEIDINRVSKEEFDESTFRIKTAYADNVDTEGITFDIDAKDIFVKDDASVFNESMVGINAGVIGMAGIGHPYSQLMLAMGSNVLGLQRLDGNDKDGTYRIEKYEGLREKLNELLEYRKESLSAEQLEEMQDEVELFNSTKPEAERDFLERSDILTVLVPLIRETKDGAVKTEGIITKEKLEIWYNSTKRKKKVKIFINSARGEHIDDEDQFIDFATDHQDVIIYLDVAQNEAKGDMHERFPNLPNFFLMGHTWSAIPEVRDAMFLRAIFYNLILFLKGLLDPAEGGIQDWVGDNERALGRLDRLASLHDVAAERKFPDEVFPTYTSA